MRTRKREMIEKRKGKRVRRTMRMLKILYRCNEERIWEQQTGGCRHFRPKSLDSSDYSNSINAFFPSPNRLLHMHLCTCERMCGLTGAEIRSRGKRRRLKTDC